MSQAHKDLFSGHAAQYRSFRPTYPKALFDYLASLSPAHDVAWDVGCGNGQSSVALAEHFNLVCATDISELQLKNAQQHSRVRYTVASAENSGLGSDSVNLIISSQAFHWFNREKFADEVKRVSKPNAILAIWAYDLCTISGQIDPILNKLYNHILSGYWEPERKLVDELYASVVMPFKKVEAPDFEMTAHWSFEHMIGYLHTWSAVQTYIRKNGRDPVDMVSDDLQNAFGSEQTRTVSWYLQPRVWQLDAP